MEQMKVSRSCGLQGPDCSPLLTLFPSPPGPSGAEAKANSFRNPPGLSSEPLTHMIALSWRRGPAASPIPDWRALELESSHLPLALPLPSWVGLNFLICRMGPSLRGRCHRESPERHQSTSRTGRIGPSSWRLLTLCPPLPLPFPHLLLVVVPTVAPTKARHPAGRAGRLGRIH